jgi:hypothetical protein
MNMESRQTAAEPDKKEAKMVRWIDSEDLGSGPYRRKVPWRVSGRGLSCTKPEDRRR